MSPEWENRSCASVLDAGLGLSRVEGIGDVKEAPNEVKASAGICMELTALLKIR